MSEVLAVTLGVVSADVGLGYHYSVPETSYGVPSHQIRNNGYNPASSVSIASNKGTAGVTTGTQGPTYTAAASNTGYVSGSSAYTTSGKGAGFNYNTQGADGGSGFNYHNQGSNAHYNFNGLGTGSSQGSYQGSVGQNAQSVGGYYQTGGSNQPSLSSSGSGYYNNYQTSNEYQSSAVNKYQEHYNQIVQQPPQIFKHFYVHAAPEEPEVPKHRQPLVLPPPQKHYKIIFIKTPAPQSAIPQFIPVPQQNEEKTIVYVLVKKPEDAQNIVLPKIEQKPPSKPEVFFIKYNSKQDSQSVIDNIVNDYNKVSVPTFGGSGSGYSTAAKDSGSSASSTGSTNIETSNDFVSATSGDGGSEGAFAISSASNAYGGAASEAENQAPGSIGSQYASVGPTVVTSSDVDSDSFSSGLQSIFGTPGASVSSSTASSESAGFDASVISTSQGIPHETYGVPKFKDY